MAIINLLDENTINQIAAGEVVERPSAVVKELIENAMDAGATAITAEIKEGGLSLIRITDNGAGIAKEDIPFAFLRHATSKIRTAEDLLSVTSLGFRGEALSSIAAVAQVELITKTPSVLNGFRYLIEGGEEKSMEEIGCPGGTTILVRNLFYNTPARRKFLKSAMTEAGYVSDLMERLIVSHPDISFKFIVNNQVKLQSSGNNNTKDILYQIYGRDISKELLPVNYHSENVKLIGYIGKPVINRGNRNFENYFINGRYIKSNVITKAIEEAYKPYMMQHKYPFTSLYFEIDPAFIDVNVHPQKLEVRLKNGEEIFELIQQVIRETLSGKELIPKVAFMPEEVKKESPVGMPEPFEQNRRRQLEFPLQKHSDKAGLLDRTVSHSFTAEPGPSKKPFLYDKNPGNVPLGQVGEKPSDYLSATKPLISSSSPLANTLTGTDTSGSMASNSKADYVISGQASVDVQGQASPVNAQAVPANTASSLPSNPDTSKGVKMEQMYLFGEEEHTQEAPFLSGKALEEHRILGQIFSTYWLVEYKKELYIIDQHAAHEKVLYERIMALAKQRTHESQQLFPPIVLTLTLKEQDILHKNEEILNSLGYEFEHFGGKEYSVRAVPANLYSLSEKDVLLEFIDSLAEEVTGGFPSATSILEKTASLSCKAAIKANHSYSYDEAAALIKELLTLENPYHCPHGRPVIISMSQYELERKFKRIV